MRRDEQMGRWADGRADGRADRELKRGRLVYPIKRELYLKIEVELWALSSESRESRKGEDWRGGGGGRTVEA